MFSLVYITLPDPKFFIFKTKKWPHFFMRLEADFFARHLQQNHSNENFCRMLQDILHARGSKGTHLDFLFQNIYKSNHGHKHFTCISSRYSVQSSFRIANYFLLFFGTVQPLIIYIWMVLEQYQILFEYLCHFWLEF